jgi:alanyl-tRNA synthetase
VREDALGRPDLDQVAIQSSVMDERGSTDVYRLGKSLRKKGFDSVGLADQLAEVQVDYDLDPEGTALTVRTTPTLR